MYEAQVVWEVPYQQHRIWTNKKITPMRLHLNLLIRRSYKCFRRLTKEPRNATDKIKLDINIYKRYYSWKEYQRENPIKLKHEGFFKQRIKKMNK